MKLFGKKEPQPIQVKEKQLTCPICENQLFWTSQDALARLESIFDLKKIASAVLVY